MKLKFRIFCILLALNSCIQKENDLVFDLDNSRVSIIKYDATNIHCSKIFQNAEPSTLNHEDLSKIELAINGIIKKQNPLEIQRFKEISKIYPNERYKLEDFVLKKEDYIRRYLVVRNLNGEKEIFVALVCDDIAKDFDFTHTLKQGHGGGSCLFSFKLNLSTNKYYDVHFNAEA